MWHREELKALFDKQVGLIESRIDDLVGTLVRWTIAHPTTPLVSSIRLQILP